MLQYATPEQRNQLGQSPALRQPFYIGDGRTRDGQRQLITVPAGATRLYLGVMDSARWNDNSGAFEVTVRSDGDSGLTLDPASGVIKWLPTTVGSYRFEGVVTDDGTPPRSVDVAYPINVVNPRSEEHTSELQSLMRISYAVFCL